MATPGKSWRHEWTRWKQGSSDNAMGYAFTRAVEQGQQQNIWKFRKSSQGLLDERAGGQRSRLPLSKTRPCLSENLARVPAPLSETAGGI